MNRKVRNFLPQSGTPVIVTIIKNYSETEVHKYIFIDALSFTGFTPDLIKFYDEEQDRNILVKFRSIEDWSY